MLPRKVSQTPENQKRLTSYFSQKPTASTDASSSQKRNLEISPSEKPPTPIRPKPTTPLLSPSDPATKAPIRPSPETPTSSISTNKPEKLEDFTIKPEELPKHLRLKPL